MSAMLMHEPCVDISTRSQSTHKNWSGAVLKIAQPELAFQVGTPCKDFSFRYFPTIQQVYSRTHYLSMQMYGRIHRQP